MVCHIRKVQSIVKVVGEKEAQVDYVRSIFLFYEKINISPKYYKHITRLEYTYEGGERGESNFIGLESVT